MTPNEEFHIFTILFEREDNLYVKDKMSGPKVSFICRFHCIAISLLNCMPALYSSIGFGPIWLLIVRV